MHRVSGNIERKRHDEHWLFGFDGKKFLLFSAENADERAVSTSLNIGCQRLLKY